jgi:hypothetical protein
MNPQAGSACAMEVVQQIGIYKTLDSSAVKPMNINYLKKEQSFFSNLVVFNPISYISSLIFRHFSLRAMARWRLAAPLLLLAFHCTAWLAPDTPGPASRRKVLGGAVVATVATVATAPLAAGAEQLKSSWPAKDLTKLGICVSKFHQFSQVVDIYNQFQMFRDVPESGIRDVV